MLAARLGWVDRLDRIDLRGDVLLVGADPKGDDVDVPAAVVMAARMGGLLAAASAMTE